MLACLLDPLRGIQEYIIQVPVEKFKVFVIVYFDTILIYIYKTDHVDIVLWVFDPFREHIFYTKFDSCCFH